MSYALEVRNLTKQYKNSSFSLKNVSFCVPYGSVMGFVGQNGAGKTTTMGCILNTLSKDSGTVKILGNELSDSRPDIKENIGVVYDASNFCGILTVCQVSKIMRGIYKQWEQNLFDNYAQKFKLPLNQKIRTFSKGMSMKLAIAAALAHSPKLLIMDEATSGLDPIVREEMLDIFAEFVSDNNHSILLSSHITSDLEKIADYITFIHDGKIILSEKKSNLKGSIDDVIFSVMKGERA